MTRLSRRISGFLAIPLLLLLLAAPTQAQTPYVGVGPTFPTGDYGEYANTGVLLVGGLIFDVGDAGLAVFGEGFFGQNGHEGGGKTQPFGIMAGLVKDFSGDADAGVYVFGEAGLLWHRYVPDSGDTESESGFGFGGGVGYGFPLGGQNAWVEGRYMSANIDYGDGFDETTSFFGIIFGLSFPRGGDGGM
jgi:hypothetical protein